VGQTDKEVAVPSFRRRASATDTEHRVEEPSQDADGTTGDALTAEEAEAQAAEAEAVAAAARAKAKAIRLRREAEEAEAKAKAEAKVKAEADAELEAETTADAQTVTVEQSDIAGEDEQEAAPSGRRWGLIVKVVAMTLAVLCTAALITASVLMVMQHRKAVENRQFNAEFAAAGRQGVVTLMSLDFTNAQENVERIIENTTGQFKTDFEDQAADFVKVAQDSKVITDVTVTAAAVESMSPDRAVVLVAATSRVTNSSGAKQEPRAWRLQVSLERVEGGQIKMAKVEFVP
jgi:Mce-associated membrane protein